MISATITTKESPQIMEIIQNAVEQIRQLSPQVRVEYINHELNIPTDETLNDLKNAKSIEKQYASHNDLINELMTEIKAEQ